MINTKYLFEDPEELNPSALPDYSTLDFISNDSHIYGEIMWPSNNLSRIITEHGLICRRVSMIREIAEFIKEVTEKL